MLLKSEEFNELTKFGWKTIFFSARLIKSVLKGFNISTFDSIKTGLDEALQATKNK